MPLENALVDEGELVKFMAKIVGYPKARVNWFVNKTHAVNLSIFFNSFFTFATSLILLKVKITDLNLDIFSRFF